MNIINEPLMTPEGYLNPACMNELESAIQTLPKTHERLSNDSEWNTKIWVMKKDITSYLAKWAISQSPYAYPEGLETVIKYLDACLDRSASIEHGSKMMNLSLCEINKLLHDILYEQGVEAFDNWNKCKVGDTPDIKYSSLYDVEKNPDRDFIDLDALLHNVCLSIRDEKRKNDAFNKKFKEEHGSLPWEKE